MTPEALAEIHARTFTTPPPWSAASLATMLQDRHVSLLTDAQGRGFALIRTVADEAELLTIAVDPPFQRQGVARDLMRALERHAQARGGARLFLEVAEDNAPARALYDACGFGAQGRRPGYYRRPDGTKIAALILCKSLA